MTANELLASLKPTGTQRIYDVLVAAGHDVNEWHRDANGNPFDDFTRNPRFRADWVFTDLAGRTLVSIWHDMISIEGGELIVRDNAREAQMRYQRMGEDYRNYQGDQRREERAKKSRGEQWARKARALDAVIRKSFLSGTPLSVAIVHREIAHDEEAESAKGRALDDSQWYVRTYGEDGEYVLVRGQRPEGITPQVLVWGQSPTPIDQARTSTVMDTSIPQPQAQESATVDSGQAAELTLKYPPITTESYGIDLDDQFLDVPAKQKESTSTYYERNPECRRTVLLRSNGFCEYCGMPGFIKSNGRTYLETHHIVALSDGGHDHPSNMIALCPNDHREAHYGRSQEELRELFLSVLQGLA